MQAYSDPSRYRTTSACVSGAICGPIWWPVGEICGRPLSFDLTDYPVRMGKSGQSFRDALNRILMDQGGDFSGARFAADTVVRVERIKTIGKIRYLHVWEREIGQLPDCADLINAQAFIHDFLD